MEGFHNQICFGGRNKNTWPSHMEKKPEKLGEHLAWQLERR